LPYDADRAPDAAAWLAQEDSERLGEIEAHHRALASHARMPKPRLHAAIHAVVETQLETCEPPEVRRALERLARGGLGRHEAIHAIGLLVAGATSAAMDGKAFDARVYARELDDLTVDRWRELSKGE
jgi:hypothetical protein